MSLIRKRALLAALALFAILLASAPARAASLGGDAETAERLGEIQASLQKLTALVDRKLEALLHPKWEYKFVSMNILASPPDLAALGTQGWELMFKSADGQFVFKRRVRE